MSWPLDQFPITEPEDEDLPLPVDVEGKDVGAPGKLATGPRRTLVDDVLDAGRPGSARPHDMRLCPLCGSTTRQRPTEIGCQTVTRRCANKACRHEYAVSSTRVLVDVPPPPPNPLLLGGPYKGGPDRGGGKPPIDPNEPIHRRVAEVMRRMTDDE